MIKVTTYGTGSSGNAYIVSDGETSLLLEAGLSPRKLGKDLYDVDAVLISHEHLDHAKYASQLSKRGLTIYGSHGTLESLDGVIDWEVMETNLWTRIGSIQIKPFDVKHDASQPFGFLIISDNGGVLLFVTDTGTYYGTQIEALIDIFNIDIAMIELNYDEDSVFKSDRIFAQRSMSDTGHMGLSDVHTLVNKLKPKTKLVFIHMSGEHLNRKTVSELIDRDYIYAEPKLVISGGNNDG